MPSREAIIRITLASFTAVWDEIDPFNIDLMHGVVGGFFINRGGTTLLLSLRLCRLGGDQRVGARRFDRSGYQRPGLRVLFSTPNHGRTHCVTFDGVRGPRGCAFAEC